MAKKKKEDKVEKTLDLLDSGLGIASSLINKRIDGIQSEAERKVGAIKEDVVESAYEAKRGLIRTLLEALFLSTGILALISGILLLFRQIGYELHEVLLAYGLIVTLYTLVRMKTSP